MSIASVVFSYPFIKEVTTINVGPQPQKPASAGFIINVSISLTSATPTPAVPPDFEARFYVNGGLIATVSFTETAGLNQVIGFALQDVTSADDLTVDIRHVTGTAQVVDWTNVSLAFTIESEDVEQDGPCPRTDPCAGAYSRDDLLSLWESSVDKGYSQQMLLLGEGEGSLEHITQGLEQLRVVSCAINRTTQAMFIRPWSGQTGEPAGGGRRACVELTVSRSGLVSLPVVLTDAVAFAEVQSDATESGSLEVETGRRYRLNSMLVLPPGDTTEKLSLASSDGVGYGYNYPTPRSIKRALQPGSSFNNDGASIRQSNAVWILYSANKPDVFIPDHVGQYVEITSDANVGLICRIAQYVPPDIQSTPPSGGGAALDCLFVVETLVFGIGNYVVGEFVTQAASGAQGVLYDITNMGGGLSRVVISKRVGEFILGTGPEFIIECQTSSFNIITDLGFYPDAKIITNQLPAEETGTASWRILDWVADIGLSVYNERSPSGGKASMLDELGSERNIHRSPGESDESYRSRVAKLADVVSPNAIKRVANRILGQYGLQACLREVGQLSMPGFYYDVTENGYYAYDMDCAVLTGFIFGTFDSDEEVILNDTPDLMPSGTAGLAQGYFAGFDPGTSRIFVARKGLNSWANSTGKFVVGKRTGAYFQVIGIVMSEGKPEDAFKTLFDYEEFRAFFTVGVQANSLGEYGFFYDAGAYGFFDTAPFYTFYDGTAATMSVIATAVWNAINVAKAGGVKADVYRDYKGC